MSKIQTNNKFIILIFIKQICKNKMKNHLKKVRIDFKIMKHYLNNLINHSNVMKSHINIKAMYILSQLN